VSIIRGMVVAHVTDGDGVCPRKEGPSPDFGLGMKPLPRLSDRLLDRPFHPLYHPSVELYCTAMCRFFVGVPSDPSTFAVAFSKPRVWVNSPIVSYHWGNGIDGPVAPEGNRTMQTRRVGNEGVRIKQG
jgi:hypothetical protein